MNKTAEEILREEVLKVTKGKDFTHNVTHDGIINAMKEYAKLVAQQSLENAANNATTDSKHPSCGVKVDKSSITNLDNIPL